MITKTEVVGVIQLLEEGQGSRNEGNFQKVK